ncbi:hypothetical protein, partial [Bacillus litorisediminis]|uniref:hypothetical protein n=1 Tax=Bacillus litorisediminis TaxID=2922713 RepID=UPI001FAE4834
EMGRWTHPTMGHDHESTISSRPPEETCEEISRITYTLFLTSPVCGTLLRFAVCFISVPGAGYFDAQFDWLLMIGYQRA